MKKYFTKLHILIYVLTIVLSYITSLMIYNNKIDKSVIFNNNLCLFLITLFIFFGMLGFVIFPYKKYLDFIYNKRWILALILFFLCVFGKFTMSSFGMWNDYIQPNYHSKEMEPVIGKALAIRSDEWLTTLPEVLSQQYNNYDINSDIVRGSETNLFIASPAPIKNILVLSRPLAIGYILFGIDYGSSIYWFGRLILLFMVTFEFAMILTKKKKGLSFLTTILITFSAPVAWWGFTELIIAGEGAIVTLHLLLFNKNTWIYNTVWSIILGICILMYGFNMYPAWMIPMGYIYLALGLYYLIYFLINNKKEKIKLLYLLIPIIMAGTGVLYFFITCKDAINLMMSTVYPGARFETGGSHYGLVFNYIFNLFMKFTKLSNPSEASVFYSFLPFVYVLMIYSLFKNNKKNKVFIILFAISLYMSIFMFIGVPPILAKISLIYFSPVERIAVPYSYLLILLTILSSESLKNTEKKEKIFLLAMAVISSVLATFLSHYFNPEFVDIKIIIVSIIISLLLNISLVLYHSRYNGLILFLYLIMFGFTFIVVNPISIKLSTIYDKPIVNELNKYRKENKDYLWIAFGDITTGDYLIANGIRSINSVNPYPNLERWYLIDKDRYYENIYNRYAHINIMPTKEETTFELVQPDMFKVNLNINDLCILKVDYTVSRSKLDEYNSKKVKLDNKYYEDGLYIYKVNCYE